MHRARPAYPILQIAGGAKLHSGRFRISFFFWPKPLRAKHRGLCFAERKLNRVWPYG